MVRFFRRKKGKEEEEAAPEAAVEAPEGEETAEVEGAASLDEAQDRHTVEEAVEKTRRTWFSRIGGMFRRGLDDELWDELEETLIAADTGVETTVKVLEHLRERVKDEGIRDPEEAQEALKAELLAVLEVDGPRGRLWGDGPGAQQAAPLQGERTGETEAGADMEGRQARKALGPFDQAQGRQAQGERTRREEGEAPRPAVVLVVGVNGTGKTTSIAKLAHAYKRSGMKVVLAAADTFRAAAIDQLKQWGERIGVDVIAHQQGADPGAVVFDALTAAQSRDADIVIIDTAGRLHTKVNLMEELRKVNRVIQRKYPEAPHEVLLVIDATSGQNALHQAKYFTEAVGVTGVLLAKLDGTAKGGVIFAVCDQLGLPVRFVGTGEGADDLAAFEPERFVEALFS